ncbi:YhgE/Pip family protein [Compostimonas suwonensis]|uniref:Putative membrane protein n=1 Tax=Compostimonas suwonensis TaxID=1048394 RepID=A0A2M9BBD1_9MICO|nr:YhgE/Pip family protein [Compostimonas suwonensis]PJJ55261.1 putative membrane protein [Compostimonas suwonensis]
MSLFGFERARSDRRVTWVSLAGLLLVPLVIGGLLVWALWDPTERLDQVTAAVVNDDEPVTLNGQTVPLGRQLAGALIDGVDDTSGAGGSSGAADSSSGTSSLPASENYNWVLTDADDAKAGLASGEYVTVVTIPQNFSAAATSYSGDAADATQATIDVATSGTSKLVDNAISQTITSTATTILNQQLTTTYLDNVYLGFNSLHDQIGTAATGAQQLADGTANLATGATGLSTGTTSLASGIGELSTGADGLASGLSQLSEQTAGLPDQTAQLAAGANALSSGANQAFAGLTTAAAQFQPVVDNACATPGPACDTAKGIQAQFAAIGAQASDFTTGLSGLADGTSRLAAGMPALTDGIAQSASGAQQLAAGVSQTSDGANQLADGAASLSSGATQLDTGAAQLATGLDQAVAQLPSYTDSERENLASVVSEPVTTTGASTELFGTSSIPLFAVLALWLGAFASYLVLQAVSRRALLTTQSSARIALRSYLPGLVLGLVQGVLVAGLMQFALELDVAHWLAYAGVAAFAGAAFAAVNQGLVALFGGVGRFVSMILIVVTLAASIISTVPPIFDTVLSWLPMSSALTAMQGVVDGTSGVWLGLGALVLWALLGLALSYIAVARKRILSLREVETLDRGTAQSGTSTRIHRAIVAATTVTGATTRPSRT